MRKKKRRKDEAWRRVLTSLSTGICNPVAAPTLLSLPLASHNNYAFRYISATRGRGAGRRNGKQHSGHSARPLVFIFVFLLFTITRCICARPDTAVTKRSNCENLPGRQYKIGIIKGALKILIYRFNVARCDVSVVFTIFPPVDFYDHRVSLSLSLSCPPQSGPRRYI